MNRIIKLLDFAMEFRALVGKWPTNQSDNSIPCCCGKSFPTLMYINVTNIRLQHIDMLDLHENK